MIIKFKDFILEGKQEDDINLKIDNILKKQHKLTSDMNKLYDSLMSDFNVNSEILDDDNGIELKTSIPIAFESGEGLYTDDIIRISWDGLLYSEIEEIVFNQLVIDSKIIVLIRTIKFIKQDGVQIKKWSDECKLMNKQLNSIYNQLVKSLENVDGEYDLITPITIAWNNGFYPVSADLLRITFDGMLYTQNDELEFDQLISMESKVSIIKEFNDIVKKSYDYQKNIILNVPDKIEDIKNSLMPQILKEFPHLASGVDLNLI